MSKPAYEDVNDRVREMDAIRKILNPDDTVKRLPARYGISFMTLRRGAPHSWVEALCIDTLKEKSETFTIGVAKVIHGIRLAERTGIMFCAVVEWKDVVCSIRIYNTDSMKMKWDDGDEPVYHIPSAHLATRFLKNKHY